MHISKGKGQWIFNETIDRVIERTQLLLYALEDVDYIVLVGEFSESKYLQTRMKDKFVNQILTSLEQNQELLGAVLIGQSATAIKDRVEKYTYGIAIVNHFKPGIHSENKRFQIDGHE
ncbi:LOW QUALITY PROTEIN: HS12A-like protein [Mya arenaria]|uniref:HS12A-like protein n=1 Tax=Mya arenaria TaxID=6604 RepID=A0ABY7DTJ5_MYAAR|nr:LOW QUALITY PROTEIN: HS12A-like protein [Mya arenaria]